MLLSLRVSAKDLEEELADGGNVLPHHLRARSKGVATIPVFTAKTEINAAVDKGVGDGGPRYAWGIVRWKAGRGASENESENAPSAPGRDAPRTVRLRFVRFALFAGFGDVAAAFVVTVSFLVVAKDRGAPSSATGRLASPPVPSGSVASAVSLVASPLVCAVFAVLGTVCAGRSALSSPFGSAKPGTVSRPWFVALRGNAYVAP